MQIDPDSRPDLAGLTAASRVGPLLRRQPGAGRGQSQAPVPATAVRISEAGREFASALGHLDRAEALRPDAVARGRQLLADWQPLDDDRAGKLADALLADGLF